MILRKITIFYEILWKLGFSTNFGIILASFFVDVITVMMLSLRDFWDPVINVRVIDINDDLTFNFGIWFNFEYYSLSNSLISENIDLQLIGIGKATQLSSISNWTDDVDVPVCADPYPFDGWNELALSAGANDCGHDTEVVKVAFPRGAVDAIALHSRLADQSMVDAFMGLPEGQKKYIWLYDNWCSCALRLPSLTRMRYAGPSACWQCPLMQNYRLH